MARDCLEGLEGLICKQEVLVYLEDNLAALRGQGLSLIHELLVRQQGLTSPIQL